MKNRIYLKKCLIAAFVTSCLLIGCFILFDTLEYRAYRRSYNENMLRIIAAIKTEYPNLTELELMEILNSSKTTDANILKKYGLDYTKYSIIRNQDELHRRYLIIGTVVFATSLVIISTVYLYYIHDKNSKIRDISKLIERINRKDYSMEIDSSTEDELSILKTELYKMTIMLKEQAENSINDKNSLKDSLSDISHQLKTPLTSIMISLDNLIDNPDMDMSTRQSFLSTIKRETSNINFLIQSLLKLSRLDTNTVEFIKDTTSIERLLQKSLLDVSMLADLKDVTVDFKGDLSAEIRCDFSWQKEAITNILKNAIEHSTEGTTITITVEKNKIYTSIAINNRGIPISKKDIPHLFERFYRGENANPESIGIGLALSKSIIKQDGGSIEVESNLKNGTTFTIKYYK